MSFLNNEEAIIENFDWNRLSLEHLKLLQSKISRAIDLKRNELKRAENLDRGGRDDEYKASLAKVFPARLRGSLSAYSSCVFIVSLGSKNFVDSQRLEACLQWVSNKFKVCMVLVCDSIYRLTLEIERGLKDREAYLEALRVGREFVEEHRDRFERCKQNCRFAYQFASETAKRSDFEDYYEEFQELYQNSESFQKMVDSFAKVYLGRGERGRANPSSELEQQKLAITYLLEESALFTCLAKDGWPVFVYPGSIKTFEEISEGLHPKTPTPLQQIIWTSVRLKRKN